MGNEGSAPGLDFSMPSLDLPEPTLGLDGPGGAPDLNMSDLKLDAPLELPGSGPAPEAAIETKAVKKAGKKAEKKKPKPEKKPKAARPKMSAPKLPRLPAGAVLPLLLNVFSMVLLLFIGGIMYLFEVPLNAVPDLSLTTYVQSIWLIVGCLVVVAMLQDLRTALIMTGIDIAMLATVFPTLWLLLDTPMNPLYFYVAGMIVLLALVVLPLNLAKARKPAAAAKQAAPAKPASTPAAAPAPTGPRTTS